MITCKQCGADATQDGLWVETYCQECWEKLCSGAWWDLLNSIESGMSLTSCPIEVQAYLQDLNGCLGGKKPLSACTRTIERELAINYGAIEIEDGWIQPTDLGWKLMEELADPVDAVNQVWGLA